MVFSKSRNSSVCTATTTAPAETRWQFSPGLTQQIPNTDIQKPGAMKPGAPTMIGTEIGLFIRQDMYLTGHAYAAIAGGAGGCQIGLPGLDGTRTPRFCWRPVAAQGLIHRADCWQGSRATWIIR